MSIQRRIRSRGIVMLIGVLSFSWVYGQETGPKTAAATKSTTTENTDRTSPPMKSVSLETARDRAGLMHDIYLAALQSMHHRYFHGDRATVPARAMEDVFSRIEKQHQLQSRWISASLSPMSINHEPKTPFEKRAAEKIARGEELVETIEDGYYRRAGSVALTGGCISCHAGMFTSTSTSPKFAGLIISVPVTPDAQLPAEAEKVEP